MYIKTAEPVNVPHLGTVLIEGSTNQNCAVMPKPQTIIKNVWFVGSDGSERLARAELWEPFETELIDVLNTFEDIERKMKNEECF